MNYLPMVLLSKLDMYKCKQIFQSNKCMRCNDLEQSQKYFLLNLIPSYNCTYLHTEFISAIAAISMATLHYTNIYTFLVSSN